MSVSYDEVAENRSAGFPAVSLQNVDNRKFGVLKRMSWRIEIGSLTHSCGWQQQIWHAEES